MPAFQRYIGIDYSGAATSTSSLKGLRIYESAPGMQAVEVQPPPSTSKYWTRRGIAMWLAEQLALDVSTLVGIDHGFSFPMQYFDHHGIEHNWDLFLDDFVSHWPTDQDDVSVETVRRGSIGLGELRSGDARWRRQCEVRCRAKSVFHFDVQGSVAKSTHSGLPWLWFLRRRFDAQVHFWPFDGWEIPHKKSAILEAYPAVYKNAFSVEGRTADQHDAFSIASWLRDADRDGRLQKALQPDLPSELLTQATVEGWILGVQ